MKSQTQVVTVMGKPVTFGQTAQGNGMIYNAKSQTLKKKGGFDWGMAADKLKEEMNKDKENNPNPEIIGGQTPVIPKKLEFNPMPNYGDRIAKLLLEKRGY